MCAHVSPHAGRSRQAWLTTSWMTWRTSLPMHGTTPCSCMQTFIHEQMHTHACARTHEHGHARRSAYVHAHTHCKHSRTTRISIRTHACTHVCPQTALAHMCVHMCARFEQTCTGGSKKMERETKLKEVNESKQKAVRPRACARAACVCGVRACARVRAHVLEREQVAGSARAHAACLRLTHFRPWCLCMRVFAHASVCMSLR